MRLIKFGILFVLGAVGLAHAAERFSTGGFMESEKPQPAQAEPCCSFRTPIVYSRPLRPDDPEWPLFHPEDPRNRR